MRHLVAGKPLNVDTQHRLALRRNLARSLFLHGRIVTTPAKAKAVRGFVEKLITRARKAVEAREAMTADPKDPRRRGPWLHHVRQIARDVPDKAVLKRLLRDIAPACKRPGGYTRILRHAKNQVGDNAPRVLFELVDREAIPAFDAPAPEAAPAPAKGAAKAAGKAPASAKRTAK